jgi:hypothetical protein
LPALAKERKLVTNWVTMVEALYRIIHPNNYAYQPGELDLAQVESLKALAVEHPEVLRAWSRLRRPGTPEQKAKCAALTIARFINIREGDRRTTGRLLFEDLTEQNPSVWVLEQLPKAASAASDFFSPRLVTTMIEKLQSQEQQHDYVISDLYRLESQIIDSEEKLGLISEKEAGQQHNQLLRKHHHPIIETEWDDERCKNVIVHEERWSDELGRYVLVRKCVAHKTSLGVTYKSKNGGLVE